MILVAILCSLAGVFAAIWLWLLAVASRTELERRFPLYAERIFRPGYQVLTRQGGPVRAFALLTVAPPVESFGPIIQMRALAAVLLCSFLSAAVAWLMT